METVLILSIINLLLIMVLIKSYINFKEKSSIKYKNLQESLMILNTDNIQHQLRTDREIHALKNTLEIKIKQIENHQHKLQEDLPIIVRKTISHIEFAKPLDTK